ncbi:class I SAM-dependent methyltransferase [Blastomonas sp.]|uniref:class I SAM-dependent methyltransferase n=1 Tax=Blastomonas sp. TaxID=1909299 RepID=UPI0035934085
MSSPESRAQAAPEGDHAAVMDGVYRTQRHIYDFTRKYYLLGRDRLIDDLNAPDGGAVLEVGCGTGRNLIVAAKRYPRAHFYGFDISAAMLESAQAAVDKAGLQHQITLARGDATAFSAQRLFGIAGFDRVFCSYTLSMIPGWEHAIAAAADALAPEGSLHIVDFGHQGGLPRWFRSALFAWLERFYVAPRLTLDHVAQAVARERGMLADTRALYRGYAQSAVIRG